MGCWRGYLSGGADLHMAQLMPLPLTVSCFRKIQIGFSFLAPAVKRSVCQHKPQVLTICSNQLYDFKF